MKGWLLDTNVVSELRKDRPDPGVRSWSGARSADSLFLSEVALAEIRYGIERRAQDEFREELELWLERTLRPWFAGRILPVDEDVWVAWRWMVQRGREEGITFSQPDLVIAATAEVHGLVVCTRNEGDFVRAGVPVFNPWSQ
ncbi:type II toxin-antitoxin system VapC family toxin [Candidatus Palauibacter sp.]|uniref:type II toxin-antitoxin system VapC family toxin n=1 Tax=Candidatus Palauibacter sp. TaxID=3101350 RepID=UPI003B02EA0A